MDGYLVSPLVAQAYQIIEQLVSSATRSEGIQMQVNLCIESLRIPIGIVDALAVHAPVICFDWHWFLKKFRNFDFQIKRILNLRNMRNNI